MENLTGKKTDELRSLLEARRELVRESSSNTQKLRHRLEFVRTIHGVDYINDSRSCDVDSTFYALEQMTKPVIWIVGGVDKGNDYLMLKDLVKEKVKAIICLGTNNNKLFEAFRFEVPMMIIDASSALEAVQMSRLAARENDVVLLSPACASYDMFEGYEDRGEQFIKAVNEIGS
jgi:UDP-N-acetylmuramoylalanine--D-glutamate ligase